jgi:hypothetical protein
MGEGHPQMNLDLSCSCCRTPLSGGHVYGLFVCLNERCPEHGKQHAIKPMQRPHPNFKPRNWNRTSK